MYYSIINNYVLILYKSIGIISEPPKIYDLSRKKLFKPQKYPHAKSIYFCISLLTLE